MKLKIDAYFAGMQTKAVLASFEKYLIKDIEKQIKSSISRGEYEMRMDYFGVRDRLYPLTLFDFDFYQKLLASLHALGFQAKVISRDEGKTLEISWRPSVVSEE